MIFIYFIVLSNVTVMFCSEQTKQIPKPPIRLKAPVPAPKIGPLQTSIIPQDKALDDQLNPQRASSLEPIQALRAHSTRTHFVDPLAISLDTSSSQRPCRQANPLRQRRQTQAPSEQEEIDLQDSPFRANSPTPKQSDTNSANNSNLPTHNSVTHPIVIVRKLAQPTNNNSMQANTTNQHPHSAIPRRAAKNEDLDVLATLCELDQK